MKRKSQVVSSGVENRIRELEDQFKGIFTHEQAIHYFAFYKVMLEEALKSIAKLREKSELFANSSTQKIDSLEMIGLQAIDEAEQHMLEKKIAEQSLTELSERSTRRAKQAADARYNRPGAARDKRRHIQEAWASGKYTSRDRCAEEECGGLNMSFSAARKALRNTPEP